MEEKEFGVGAPRADVSPAANSRATDGEPPDPFRQLRHLAQLIVDRREIDAGEFWAKYPDYAHSRDGFERYIYKLAVAALVQAGEARRAETRSGSVHEHAVGEADAPTLASLSHPNTQEG